MMDVSDGLAKDLDSLTPDSLAPALFEKNIPISTAARLAARRTDASPLHHALCDGEDYELLIVVRARSDQKRFERDWKKRFPKIKLSHLGQFLPKRQTPSTALRLIDYRGYEHLR